MVGNKNPGAHPGVFWGLTSEYKFVSGDLCSVGFNAVRIEMSDGVSAGVAGAARSHLRLQ